MAFFGFNNKRKSTLGGDFDGDGVKNRKDCEPLNFRKQGPLHALRERSLKKKEADIYERMARLPEEERLPAIRRAREIIEEQVQKDQEKKATENRVKKWRATAYNDN